MSAHPAVGSRNVLASRLCWSSTSAGWQGTSSRLRRPSCVAGCTPRRTTWSCCNRTPDSHIRPYNQPISWFANINTHRRRLFFLFFLGQRTNSHSLPSSPLPLEVRPIYTARGSGERCKLPQWHMGEAPAYKRFDAYWSQKVQLWRQQFLLIFLRKKANFLHKTSLISHSVTICIIDCQCIWVQFLREGGALWDFFQEQSPPLPYGSRRLCQHTRGNVNKVYINLYSPKNR